MMTQLLFKMMRKKLKKYEELNYVFMVLLSIACLFNWGCGPSLINPEIFTVKRVKEIKYNDMCELQDFFNNNPSRIEPYKDVASGTSKGVNFGIVNYFLHSSSPYQIIFLKTVKKFFTNLPSLDSSNSINVELLYHDTGGRRFVPIGAEMKITNGKISSLSIPYHPCIGAIFFEREYFIMRKRLIEP